MEDRVSGDMYAVRHLHDMQSRPSLTLDKLSKPVPTSAVFEHPSPVSADKESNADFSTDGFERRRATTFGP